VKLRLMGMPPRVIRRAVFIYDHPEQGILVLDQSLFKRRMRLDLNECIQGGSQKLIDVAHSALKHVGGENFGGTLRRYHPFRLRGSDKQLVDCVVFCVEPKDLNDGAHLFRLIKDSVTALAEHSLAMQIYTSIAAARKIA